MTSGRLFETAWTICHHAAELSIKLVFAWLRWFWRLTIAAKIAATAVEIVLLYLAARHLPLTLQVRGEIIAGGTLALAFLLLFGVLLASARLR